MTPTRPTPTGRQLEALLDSGTANGLDAYLRQEARRRVEATGFAPSHYDVFVVRRNDQLGDEVFGPKRLHVGTYSEEALYGVAGSRITRFRAAIRTLQDRLERLQSVAPGEVEYGHQTSLLWAEVGRLKDFIGAEATVSELVAELRTARFQYLGQDTPPEVVGALASALSRIADADRLDAALVDEVVEILQDAGVDSLAPDALRECDA